MKFHILKVLGGLGGDAKDGRCVRNLGTEQSAKTY